MRPASPSISYFPALRTLALACGLALAGCAQTPPAAGQAGGPDAVTPAALRVAAEKAQPAVVDHLREMVLIESGSKQKDGLLKMADGLEQRLQALGFKTERRHAMAGAGADNLIGTLKGSGKRKFMLLAHMDTVYGPGILATQPFKVDGNRIYGPGSADDKGGIAVIIGALQILRNAGWNDFDTITVMFNPDEEVGSQGSGELIAELAAQHDVALGFEPSAGKAVTPNHIVLLGASGILEAKLSVSGRAAHAGNSPKDGRNALYELAHQMLQTRGVAEGIPGAQLNWTVAQTGGNPFNQIPAKAEAVGDVRINQAGADEKLNAALQQKIKAQLIPDTQVAFKLETNRPIYLAGAKGRALAERSQAIYKELGLGLTLVPMTGGGTDAAYLARSGKAAVLESLGLAGWGYHARDEYVEADSIVPRLYLLTRLLTELARS